MTTILTGELRRKRILYRATHRGTKEADAVVGGYFLAATDSLPENKLGEAEALLDVPDLDLLDWLMERAPVPPEWQGTLFDDLAAFYLKLKETK